MVSSHVLGVAGSPSWEEVVRRAIEQDRQCVSKARAAWEQATGKEASDMTFKHFLSALAQDISV
ncbi:MAG: hypothetical protein SOZ07_02700 [Prevotella sp.]|nr:hypothetical protein [Prevotellaceae bacterium]MDY3935556.1 hypothetical protein [Prevotella sp.]